MGNRPGAMNGGIDQVKCLNGQSMGIVDLGARAAYYHGELQHRCERGVQKGLDVPRRIACLDHEGDAVDVDLGLKQAVEDDDVLEDVLHQRREEGGLQVNAEANGVGGNQESGGGTP